MHHLIQNTTLGTTRGSTPPFNRYVEVYYELLHCRWLRRLIMQQIALPSRFATVQCGCNIILLTLFGIGYLRHTVPGGFFPYHLPWPANRGSNESVQHDSRFNWTVSFVNHNSYIIVTVMASSMFTCQALVV